MKSLFSLTSLLALLLLPTSGLTAEPHLKPMIQGADLAGWRPDPATSREWTFKDGVLHCENDDAKKGSTLWTKQEYGDFVMELEFRFGIGTVDTGVFVRNNKEQIQIGISGSLKRDMTASPYIAGKGYPVEAEGVKELLKLKDWNHLRIEARGKTYTSWLNGKKVMTYTSESAIDRGPVGFQLHPNRDMSCDFRNLKIAELK